MKSIRGPTCRSTQPCTTAAPRRLAVPARAQASASASSVDQKDALVGTIKQFVTTPSAVPKARVLSSILALEKLKVEPEGDQWLRGLKSGVWKLVYTAASKDVVAAGKGQPEGSGNLVPIAAANKFTEDFENGVFLGPVAHLTFKGPFLLTGRRGQFDVNVMSIGLGPWKFSIPLKKSVTIPEMSADEKKKLPFFLYAYVDEDIVVARGRSGGVAIWVKANSEWLAQSGVLPVYK